MNLVNDKIKERIQDDIINPLLQDNYTVAMANIARILDEMYASIPDKNRISYGRVYTIKILSEYLYTHFAKTSAPLFQIVTAIFEKSNDFQNKGVALGMLSFNGLDHYDKVLPYFEAAAKSENWDEREFAQMFFKKLIKKYPNEIKNFLLLLAKSEDANARRFVGETLRPVQENRWFFQNPGYPLSILKHLFTERSPYPRTSVGNNLSDLARKLPELVYELVKDLVASNDKNSYWIACRACRNLVKKEPLKVLDLLKTDEYKYKKRIYKKSDYQ